MIVLITPTGGRPLQIFMTDIWMKQQTYQGQVAWIIVDDCLPRTTDFISEEFQPGWEVTKIYPTPPWEPYQNTQARNIAAGIKAMVEKYPIDKIEAIFIIEDDDYYKPIYLQRMMEEKQGFDLWGESNTIYYNVNYQRYAANNNFAHASLFQTAFTPKILPEFEGCYLNKFIDFVFWSKIPNRKLFSAGTLAVGMKGMQGREGIGAGHSKAFAMLQDPDWSYLKKLIGPDNAIFYERYYSDSRNPQHEAVI